MTALIWMLSYLPAVLPAVGQLPTPTDVTLTSLNFTYMLKWGAGPGTPEGVHYKVTYMPDSKGHSWDPVAGCECVQKPRVCNLTLVFSDLKEKYLMRVTAHLGERASPPGYSQYGRYGFKPISQLSLPLLSVTPSGRNLRVDLHPPMEHLRGIYGCLYYELQISSDKDKLENITIQSLRYSWENLAPGRRYCVAVRFNDKLEDIYSNFSRPKCVAIPTTFSADLLISVVMSSMVIFIVVCFIMLILTGFICLRRRSLPLVLTTIHHLDEVRVNDPYVISSLLNVEPPAPSAGEKGSSRSSSDESDEDGETERTSASTGGLYTQQVGTNPLSSFSSSSSSSSRLSQPKPLPDFTSNQLPYSQPDAQISTGSPSRAGLELRTNLGERPKEEDMAQDVNLLTLTFGRVEQEEEEEEEEEEKSDLDVQEVEFDPRLATEDTTDTVHEDEEEDEVSGYMGRPGV